MVRQDLCSPIWFGHPAGLLLLYHVHPAGIVPLTSNMQMSASSKLLRLSSMENWAYIELLRSMVYVDRTTLHDKVSGKVGFAARCGSDRRLLTDEEESTQADFQVGCSSIGYSKSRKDALVNFPANPLFPKVHTEVTRGWWESFHRRHPDLTLSNACWATFLSVNSS